jgi:hypothetical protein
MCMDRDVEVEMTLNGCAYKDGLIKEELLLFVCFLWYWRLSTEP